MLTTIILVLTVLVVIIFMIVSSRSQLHLSHGTTLDRYTTDLTALAVRGELDPVIGREDEIRRVIQTLSRRTKDNVVLIGNAGVGKTAIVTGLAEAIVEGRVPEVLVHKRVLSLDLNALVAGTKYRGDFESRLVQISDEIRSARRSIILFIDEIHTLTETGQATGAVSAGDILKPALARGDLQVIGATTPLEYEKYIHGDTTLDRRLQPILVREPTPEQSLAIITALRSRYETHHGVQISDEALKAIVSLADKYLPGRSYPDKAIDLMDETASMVKLRDLRQSAARPIVHPSDVEAVVTNQTGDVPQAAAR